MTAAVKPAEYGTEPSYDGPPVHRLLRLDLIGLYRRESVDLQTGRPKTDPVTGATVFDEIRYTTRRHMDMAKKGYRLVRLVAP